MLRHPLVAALAGAALLALPLQALAQADRFIDRVDRADRWQRDPVARVIGQVIGQPPSQPVMVENRPIPAPAQSPSLAPEKKPGPAPQQMKSGKPDRGPEKRLVEKYDGFAGSEMNARELVEGLRNDAQIDLSKSGKTTSFTPATSTMGWGNVDHALGLAEASLAEHGIHKPTPDQIKAALNGGTITTKSGQTVKLDGVLKLRASGMGWGQIAHKMGFKLGELRRADNDRKHAHKNHDGKHAHDHKHASWKHDRDDRKHDRHEWADSKRHERPHLHRTKFDRPHKIERPERHERPHRPERPERHHHRR